MREPEPRDAVRLQRVDALRVAPMPIVISPALGRIMPEIARIVVVLPAPFEPISVTTLRLRHLDRDAVQHLDLAVAGVQISDR